MAVKELVIRPYQATDGRKVKGLITFILDREFTGDRDFYPSKDLDDISGSYSGPRDIFYVLVKKGQIIGTVAVKEDYRNCALLRRIFVDPAYRGLGLGLKLIKKAIIFCKKTGYSKLVFRSTDKMVSAIELCKKNGFVERACLSMGDTRIFKFTLNLKNNLK